MNILTLLKNNVGNVRDHFGNEESLINCIKIKLGKKDQALSEFFAEQAILINREIFKGLYGKQIIEELTKEELIDTVIGLTGEVIIHLAVTTAFLEEINNKEVH